MVGHVESYLIIYTIIQKRIAPIVCGYDQKDDNVADLRLEYRRSLWVDEP